LVRYYEILAEDENSDIPRLGYSKAGVSYALNISKAGELLSVIPLKIPSENGKKMVPQSMTVPIKLRKTSDISSNFLFDNSNYTIGVAFDEKGKSKLIRKKCFESFKTLHTKILGDLDCEKAMALVNFVKKWEVEKVLEHPAIMKSIDDIISSESIVFMLDGQGFIHDDKKIQEKWEQYYSDLNADSTKILQCLVTGKKSKIELTHPKISGVGGTNPALVSFDEDSDAYNSYGKEKQKGINAPVSKYACFAYSTALDYIIKTKRNKIHLGYIRQKSKGSNDTNYEYYKKRDSETTVVFWAESSNHNVYEKTFESLFEADSEKQGITDSLIKDILFKVKNASPINFDDTIVDMNTNFYIFGVSPAKGRLSVKFFIKDSFGNFIEKINDHYRDLRIEKEKDFNLSLIPIHILLAQTVSQKSSDTSADALIESAVVRAIITGMPYPAVLFNSIMIRIRAERDINYYKAAIIKAYLIRKHKNSNKFKEVLTVSLNEQSNNRAYVLGRLFSVLEKAQQDASDGKLNSTIKDRYFTSACATPASVFPILLRLSQHHISKAEFGKANDIRIAKILDVLDIEKNPIPAHLSLEEQGVFVLGYYHQKNALYKKNS
jgi:CRISPR-associated protein Csd1